MSYKTSFLAARLNGKKLRADRFLYEMNLILPMNKFVRETNQRLERNKTGRPAMDTELMLKIIFLQQWFNLSDPEMEDMIYDRISFQKYLDIDIMTDRIPDETTILRFRHFMEEHNLQKRFFDIINEILEEKGLLLKEGTSVDATIIAAPSSTKNKRNKRDPEMKSTKKGNNYYFGMKAHIGVDSDSGAIHTVKYTSANAHDNTQYEELLHGKEKKVFGDKAYDKQGKKKEARKEGVFYGIINKAPKGKKLSKKQEKHNSFCSRIRAKVEHPFQVLKCQWGYRKTRYKGIMKNACQLTLLFGLVNLYRFRKQLAI